MGLSGESACCAGMRTCVQIAGTHISVDKHAVHLQSSTQETETKDPWSKPTS